MRWLKWFGLGLAALLAIALALPFLFSVDDYIPRVEREISAKLGEPVSISKMRVILLPVPHAVVDGMTVGNTAGKTADLKVGKITVTPDLLSLFGPDKVVRSIEIESLVMTQKALDKIPLWSRQDDRQAAVRIGALRLDDALVKLDAADFGPFDARVAMHDNGEPREISVVTRDGKLKALIVPDKGKPPYAISASAKGWKSPVGPALVFDELEVRGVATLKDATFNEINAKLYGGTIKGTANTSWQKGIQVRGKFDLSQVEMKNIVPLVSPGTKMSGRLSARPVFSASAPEASRLNQALHVETPFEVHNGVLHGVDLQKAAMSLVGQGGAGGETRFEQLSGHLVMDRGAYKFTGLKVASGSLAAEGKVGISPRKELSGRVTAKVNALGTNAAVALNVGGTVQSPSLMPTGGTMAGAAIGTAVLPGIGTGVGAAAGQMLEGLFGKKPPAK
jgi:uncharacterized protein involved in outer membrane biogenesis